MRRLPLLLVTLGLLVPASADASFVRMRGYDAPGTPSRYDKVGVIKTGPRGARNVLVLNPGTSASAAYFTPLARDIVRRDQGWQVWAVERRENLLEDHSELDRAKGLHATPQELYDYYLGFLDDGSVKNHFQFIPDADVGFARDWGMRVAVEDLRRVVRAAGAHGRRVVLGGHSLGGSITTAYATWQFGSGKRGAGYRGLSGLVYIDGGSGPTPVTVDAANESLKSLAEGSPWLAFGGIPSPFTGLFNGVAAALVKMDPGGRSPFEHFSLLPASLRPPVPATTAGGYGYALDVATSPAGLVAAQAHLGHLASSGDPRGWERDGALTPIQRYATMFSGWGQKGLDGTAWYHPRRLTIDSGAVADGNRNAAQKVLDVRAIRGHDLPRSMRIYAFGAALGGRRVLDAATALARQSKIPRRNLTLVDRHTTYAHNDPSSASPKNDFVKYLVPFLRKVARGR